MSCPRRSRNYCDPHRYELASDRTRASLQVSTTSSLSDYGGYVAIGYNSAKVSTPPTSFADLLKPAYKNEVAINGRGW